MGLILFRLESMRSGTAVYADFRRGHLWRQHRTLGSRRHGVECRLSPADAAALFAEWGTSALRGDAHRAGRCDLAWLESRMPTREGE